MLWEKATTKDLKESCKFILIIILTYDLYEYHSIYNCRVTNNRVPDFPQEEPTPHQPYKLHGDAIIIGSVSLNLI